MTLLNPAAPPMFVHASSSTVVVPVPSQRPPTEVASPAHAFDAPAAAEAALTTPRGADRDAVVWLS
jgi:hypothetical protein